MSSASRLRTDSGGVAAAAARGGAADRAPASAAGTSGSKAAGQRRNASGRRLPDLAFESPGADEGGGTTWPPLPPSRGWRRAAAGPWLEAAP